MQSSSAVGNSSLVGAVKLFSRLAPKQLNDEISLAKAELKRKGIALGIAVAILVVALIFLAFLLVGLIVAAIMGLATIMPAWLAALLISAAFLLIALVAALIGKMKLSKAMPLKPEHAILGLRRDLGMLKEGRDFDPASLRATQLSRAEAKARKAQKSEKAKAAREAKEAQQGPAPTEEQLQVRLGDRRQHLLALRMALVERLAVRQQAKALLDAAGRTGRKITGSGNPGAGRLGQPAAEMMTAAKERWAPLTVLAISAAALVILLRKLAAR
ncbi:phage holin family protein [Paenarthrobacter sp. Z7-10]|uniref:phage holin family protein n=1 Tax=Paenarthrobacter sp. Z7-10 TaxID=2787635 RepID=UPI0022A9B06D|nr:phage holin family protein [Paenarthrobacter sp. Z7-10]MCZ2402515.1 phage holin family protein [Paenarthrobacter sp. Z7-10]